MMHIQKFRGLDGYCVERSLTSMQERRKKSLREGNKDEGKGKKETIKTLVMTMV